MSNNFELYKYVSSLEIKHEEFYSIISKLDDTVLNEYEKEIFNEFKNNCLENTEIKNTNYRKIDERELFASTSCFLKKFNYSINDLCEIHIGIGFERNYNEPEFSFYFLFRKLIKETFLCSSYTLHCEDILYNIFYNVGALYEGKIKYKDILDIFESDFLRKIENVPVFITGDYYNKEKKTTLKEMEKNKNDLFEIYFYDN